MRELEFFNTAGALENIGGDEEIYLEILKTFADTYGDNFLEKDAPELLNLERTQILQDLALCEKLGKSFHKIKGASLTVGANKLGEASKALELFFRTEEERSAPNPADKLKTLLDHFEKMYESTIEELQSLF